MTGTQTSPNKTKLLNIFLDLRKILERIIYELTVANGKYELYQKIEQIIELETDSTQIEKTSFYTNRDGYKMKKMKKIE